MAKRPTEVIMIPVGHRISEMVLGVLNAEPSIKCECNPTMRFTGTLSECAELYAIHIANLALRGES